MAARSLALVLSLLACSVAFGQEKSMDEELARLQRRREALLLGQVPPDRFLPESEKLANEYLALGKRYAVSQSHGVRSEAGAILTDAALFARMKTKDARKAIELYRRAATIHGSALTFHEEIADTYQFDLGDLAAAAATLKELQPTMGQALNSDHEMADWWAWKAKWLEAEIAYLEKGERFTGDISATEMSGFIPQLYVGAGQVSTLLIDPALNPFAETTLTPTEIEKKLIGVPPSHATFLRTWRFATGLPGKASARRWLERNDPAGFWTASLLTLAAVAERDLDKSADPRFDVVASIIKKPSGEPTPFALLGREYAKTHRLPEKVKFSRGH